jgi:hypothetical protein
MSLIQQVSQSEYLQVNHRLLVSHTTSISFNRFQCLISNLSDGLVMQNRQIFVNRFVQFMVAKSSRRLAPHRCGTLVPARLRCMQETDSFLRETKHCWYVVLLSQLVDGKDAEGEVRQIVE